MSGLKRKVSNKVSNSKNEPFDCAFLTKVNNMNEADVIMSMLAQKGVESLRKKGVTPGSVYNPDLPLAQDFKAWEEIWVNKKKIDLAKEILQDFKKSQARGG
jgi:hypothetical protein